MHILQGGGGWGIGAGFGRKAREFTPANFGWERVAVGYLEELERLVRRKGGNLFRSEQSASGPHMLCRASEEGNCESEGSWSIEYETGTFFEIDSGFRPTAVRLDGWDWNCRDGLVIIETPANQRSIEVEF